MQKLSPLNCVTFDGASTMMGCHSGVATLFKRLNGTIIVVHCFGHGLDLEVKSLCQKHNDTKGCFDTVTEVAKLVKKSPKRQASLKELS